jgi:hypothetical protein
MDAEEEATWILEQEEESAPHEEEFANYQQQQVKFQSLISVFISALMSNCVRQNILLTGLNICSVFALCRTLNNKQMLLKCLIY